MIPLTLTVKLPAYNNNLTDVSREPHFSDRGSACSRIGRRATQVIRGHNVRKAAVCSPYKSQPGVLNSLIGWIRALRWPRLPEMENLVPDAEETCSPRRISRLIYVDEHDRQLTQKTLGDLVADTLTTA